MAKYVKTVPIEAEQFDPDRGIIPDGVFNKEFEYTTSDMLHQMAERALTGRPVTNWYVATLEGNLKVAPGDWIATGVNGEHWAIKDDVFKKTYAELPVIPSAIAEYISAVKNGETDLENITAVEAALGAIEYDQASYIEADWIQQHGDTFARAWLDGYQVEEDK